MHESTPPVFKRARLRPSKRMGEESTKKDIFGFSYRAYVGKLDT